MRLAITLYLATTLATAGLAKALNPYPAARFVSRLTRCTWCGRPALVRVLGCSEIALGTLAISGLYADAVSLSLLILFGTFGLIVTFAWLFRLDVGCGCLGSTRPVDPARVAVGLVQGIAAWGHWWLGRSYSHRSLLQEVCLAVFVVGFAWLAVHSFLVTATRRGAHSLARVGS